MFRSLVWHDIPISDIASMERWYYQFHGPEIVRRYGPWMQRFECYMPVAAPAYVYPYGFYNWRVTEGWWRETPSTGCGGTMALTVPPATLRRRAACFFPAQPTEDFMGADFQPKDKSVLRWQIMMKYPEGVTKDEGEDWFLNTHVKEVMKQPGLYRYFSYKTIKEEIHLPGHFPPGNELPSGVSVLGWDRVAEMWYETFDDWHKSVIEMPPMYTKPSWAKYEQYPFLEPYVDFASTFILERPIDEFLRDARVYL